MIQRTTTRELRTRGATGLEESIEAEKSVIDEVPIGIERVGAVVAEPLAREVQKSET